MFKKRALWSLVIAGVFVFGLFSGVLADSSLQSITAQLNAAFKIVLNGSPFVAKETDGSTLSPIFYKDRTYLPLRAISEALGKNVQYDAESATAYVSDEKAVLNWELKGSKAVDNPESVIYDSKRDCIYVINTTDGSSANAFVSKISTDGKVISERFVDKGSDGKGLVALRGSLIVGDSLYVNQLNALTEIDLSTATVKNTYVIANTKMLNDIAVDTSGNIYSSDINGDAIYRLSGGKFEAWLTNKEGLAWPNGLRVEGNKMYLCPWGIADPKTWVPFANPSVKVVDLTTKAITELGSAPKIGSLDGLEEFDLGNLLVSNWWKGEIFKVNKTTGNASLILNTGLMSCGDINYIQSKKMLLVPIGNAAGTESHKIIAYTIK